MVLMPCVPASTVKSYAIRRRAISPREQVAVDAAEADHHAVGGRVLDEILDACGASLRGNHQRPIFDESSASQMSSMFSRAVR